MGSTVSRLKEIAQTFPLRDSRTNPGLSLVALFVTNGDDDSISIVPNSNKYAILVGYTNRDEDDLSREFDVFLYTSPGEDVGEDVISRRIVDGNGARRSAEEIVAWFQGMSIDGVYRVEYRNF
jgi:hypothetical protein